MTKLIRVGNSVPRTFGLQIRRESVEGISKHLNLLSLPGKCLYTRADFISLRGDLISLRGKGISSYGEGVSSHRDLISSRHDLISSRGERVSSHRDLISWHGEGVSLSFEDFCQAFLADEQKCCEGKRFIITSTVKHFANGIPVGAIEIFNYHLKGDQDHTPVETDLILLFALLLLLPGCFGR